MGRESRDEVSVQREQPVEDTHNSKAKSSPSSNQGDAGNGKKGGRFAYPNTGNMPNNGSFGNPMGLGGAPYGGGPPPYGYMNSSFGPPPPHFQPPSQMSMGSYSGAPFLGSMNGLGMNGTNYPAHVHYHGAPYGMPPAYPHQQPQTVPSSYSNMGASSDSASITSKSSMNSKKKRTIDGMSSNLPSAYTFRRTDSNSSTASTLTAGNNTSMETTNTDESLQTKRDHSDSLSLNIDGMVFEDKLNKSNQNPKHSFHRRANSGASTASSLSVCGFSLASYEGQRDDLSMASSKRQKKSDRAPLVVDTSVRQPEHMIIKQTGPSSGTSAASSASGRNIFLTLSTSPINADDIDATPLKTNITGNANKKLSSDEARPSDTPTPPVHGELGDADINEDHSMLNSHLRGQSFTPLAHLSSDHPNASPSNLAFAAGLAPQLSWSIAGDTPSLGDLAEWEEDNGKLKTDSKPRPSSTTSTDSRNMPISPHDFQLWKGEHELSDTRVNGTTTPLPVFFGSGNEGSENHQQMRQMGNFNDSQPFVIGSNSTMKMGRQDQSMWGGRHDQNMGVHPMFSGSEYRDDGFVVRSPYQNDRRDNVDFYAAYAHMGHAGMNERIRNLRGRVLPGVHMPPMPIHMPPTMSGHLPMTSPMGLGGVKSLWSPHHHGGMPGALAGAHHMGSPLANMTQSKRKCVPLKPPIPSKFQGDIEKTKSAPVPEFTSLVNFPSHMSQKQSVNLPEGMRCCVMCGQACPCSSSNKGKKGKNKATGSAPAQRNEHLGDKSSGYALIPSQNKGLCTLCDVNVWVVVTTGLEIKWCKGCKNFRPWAAFGDKGLATKCLRCRDRQREKYALQKEEKEKARAANLVESQN